MKTAVKFLALLGTTAAATALYAHYLEPNMLRKRKISVGNLSADTNNTIKLVHFTDVHLGKYYNLHKFYRLISEIKKQNPDIVVFTGDLIDNPQKYSIDRNKISRALKRIKAPLGKYAVTGNHEIRYNFVKEYEKILKKGGFTLLRDESIYLPQENINIVGCDSSTRENIKNEKRLIPLSKEDFSHIQNCDKLMSIGAFNILLTHHPDVIDELTHRCCDLVLAGHSHGGQIRCPVIEKFFIPTLAKKYTRGINKTCDGCLVHTCEGVGMTRLPFRFLSLPTIGIVNIKL